MVAPAYVVLLLTPASSTRWRQKFKYRSMSDTAEKGVYAN